MTVYRSSELQFQVSDLHCNLCSSDLPQRVTHRPLSSSFLRFMFRILEGNPKKELLRVLWAVCTTPPKTTK